MAGTSPRRSSRARTTQSTSNNSSSASSTSGRSERNTRSFNKTGSPQKSTGTSLSSEPPDDAVPESTPTTRRRTRALDDERDRSTKAESVEMAIDDIQEDDEAIRCVCGFDDYPGPPPFDPDAKHGKDAFDNEPISASDMTDDLAGFYLQCDSCNVWQHGACFGITEESSTPDNWYCEQCRPELHKVSTASNGQRYSNYLPLKRPSRTTSRAGSLVKEGTRSPKETTGKNGRLSSSAQTSKRRSTMNSRYDEEEELRRAIEASKEDALPEHPEPTSRRAKRGRSDSEEKSENIKRQRTDSRSLSPPAEKDPSSPDESAETTNTRIGSSSKKSRNASYRSQREKTEREERERQRAEAAKKRNGRAERRRADDSPPEETPLVARTLATKPVETPQPPPPAPVEPAVSQPSPDTPPAVLPLMNSSHKKGGRPTHKKGKGRNQYTKDRDVQDEDSPARPQSKEAHKPIDENGHNTSNHKPGDWKQAYKQPKPVLPKVSIHDMNRRANWIMDFISRTQMELAGEEYTKRHPTRRSGDAAANQLVLAPSCDDAPKPVPETNGTIQENREFKDLSSMEMMDFLAREIIQWQQEHYSELKT